MGVDVLPLLLSRRKVPTSVRVLLSTTSGRTCLGPYVLGTVVVADLPRSNNITPYLNNRESRRGGLSWSKDRHSTIETVRLDIGAPRTSVPSDARCLFSQRVIEHPGTRVRRGRAEYSARRSLSDMKPYRDSFSFLPQRVGQG